MKTTLNSILQLSLLFLGLWSYPVQITDCIQANNPSSLILSCQSNDAIIVDNAIKDLQRIPLSDFNSANKEAVAKLLKKNSKHLDRIIKLAGFLQLEAELLNIDKDIVKDKHLKQALNLALVRAGNIEKTDLMLQNIKKMPLDDHFSYEVVPSIVYARQKILIDQLLSRILEPGTQCNPPDLDTNGNVSCAYSIIEQIAPYIDNFPVSLDRYGIKTDNYPRMLADVRLWIDKNKESYTISFEKY